MVKLRNQENTHFLVSSACQAEFTRTPDSATSGTILPQTVTSGLQELAERFVMTFAQQSFQFGDLERICLAADDLKRGLRCVSPLESPAILRDPCQVRDLLLELADLDFGFRHKKLPLIDTIRLSEFEFLQCSRWSGKTPSFAGVNVTFV
jgi:hypothetical protein